MLAKNWNNFENVRNIIVVETQRLDYIDVCKGLGIILVILGHTYYAPQIAYNLIYSFHMPLFFIIAGFTYDNEKNSKNGFLLFAKKKAKSLLIPYFIFAILNLFAQVLWKTIYLGEDIQLSYFLNNLKGILFCYSSMQHMPNCSPIWFLLCLFIANLILFCLFRLNKKISTIIAIACMLCCYILSLVPHDYTSYPWKFPVFLMAAFLMYIGYYFRIYINKLFYWNRRLVLLGSIAITIIALMFELMTGNQVGMNENSYGNIIIFLLTAISFSCFFIILCKSCPGLCRVNTLLWLGRNTIYIVGFNYLCRDIAAEVYYLIPYINTHRISFIPLFVITLIICVLCVWICCFIRTKYTSVLKRKG